MRKKIKEKLAMLEFVDGVAQCEITQEEATKIQQIIFDMDDLKEKMTQLTFMVNERCNEEKDDEMHALVEEIYLQHLANYEQEEYLEDQEDDEEKKENFIG